MVKVIMIAHNQQKFVQTGIEVLKIFSNIEKEDIILVDNGSKDGLKDWMEHQEDMQRIYCEEVENFSKILNTAVKEFGVTCDILLLNPYCILLPHCLEYMEKVLHSSNNIGAVGPEKILENTKNDVGFQEAVTIAETDSSPENIEQRLRLDVHALLIKSEVLLKLQKFEESLKLPRNVALDYLFRANCEDYRMYQCRNAYAFSFTDMSDIYTQMYGEEADRTVLKEKWKMNYFTDDYNEDFIRMIHEDKLQKIKILEVGCDCGTNLLELRNRYPNARLYGIEVNASSVEIAKHVAEVVVGNIEEMDIPFSDIHFDYILFGDVLEHLKNPAEVISYCRRLLNENGRLLACIPNLMHISVIRELLNGNFKYTDMGLLDKTHIHLFTYNEIVRMFQENGYEIEKLDALAYGKLISEQDRILIRQLVELADGAEEYMYQAFQYLVTAKPMPS